MQESWLGFVYCCVVDFLVVGFIVVVGLAIVLVCLVVFAGFAVGLNWLGGWV